MALRTLLAFSKGSEKCFAKHVKCYKTLLEIPNSSSKSHRGFKRMRDNSNQSESPLSDVIVNSSVPSIRTLWKPLGFTIIFGSAAHFGAAIWEYERIRSHTYKIINHYQQWRVSRTGWRKDVEKWWQELSDGQRIFAPICFINVLVFLGWRIPALKAIMVRYFCTNPASSAICWPMVFSTFSHFSILHLGVNMYVLHSFSTAAVATLGREQFLALYLTSGVMAGFFSHVYKTVFHRPGLSIGASGAIMGVVSFICMQYPETRLSIAFLPIISFTAGNAIKGLLAMDTLGCMFGWRVFDHAAHLGGALWGIFWQQWGNLNIWQKREPILRYWHNIRKPTRPD